MLMLSLGLLLEICLFYIAFVSIICEYNFFGWTVSVSYANKISYLILSYPTIDRPRPRPSIGNMSFLYWICEYNFIFVRTVPVNYEYKKHLIYLILTNSILQIKFTVKFINCYIQTSNMFKH